MSKIIDLSNYDLVLATGLGARHAVSGHTFELLEYWWYFKQHGVNVAILCTAHKPDIIITMAEKRYAFTEPELEALRRALFDGTDTVVAKLPKTLWVDGSISYISTAVVQSKFNAAFACNNSHDFKRMDIILADTRIYDFKCYHYIKKLLFDKFAKINCNASNTAMLYCTIQARRLNDDYLNNLLHKFKQFDQFILVTNDDCIHERDNVKIVPHPCYDIFDKFTTYIYSPLTTNWHDVITDVVDCSPRFPAECTFYGKDIIIDAPINRGLGVRLHDCENLQSIALTHDDGLVDILF